MNLDIDFFARFTVFQGVGTLLNYSNSTKQFTYIFNDPNTEIAQGCLKIERETLGEEKIIVDQTCVLSTAGVITITLSENVTRRTYIGTGTIIFNSEPDVYITDVLTIKDDQLKQFFGASGLFMAMFLVIVFIMVGNWHPVISLSMMGFSLIVSTILGLITFGQSLVVILLIIISAIVALQRRR